MLRRLTMVGTASRIRLPRLLKVGRQLAVGTVDTRTDDGNLVGRIK